MLISNTLKKFYKNALKKVASKTSLMKMDKSGKSAYFSRIFDYNFFSYIFFDFFNGLEISVKFCIFLHLFWFCKKHFFFGHISTFQTLKSNAQKTAKKNIKLFF